MAGMRVEVQGLCKRFDTVRAVDGVSFAAEPGAIFGLLGPNGAGKSTTIRIIVNILAPDAGRVLFDGRPAGPADRDRIGYLPEERGLYRKMTVNDVLLYFASLKGKRPGEVQAGIDRWLARLQLSEWKGRKVRELSKGMSQKVQFVAAVAHEPEVLFLDEPFAGLDPVSTEVLQEAIRELGRQGRTILFSTHIMDQAERLCSQVFIIDRGRELLSGTLEEIKRRYGRNSVAVEFDGDLDFLKGSGLVTNLLSYPRWVEAELAPGRSADELLQAIAGRVSVKRFEVMAPSLHKIFVDRVGAAGGTGQ